MNIVYILNATILSGGATKAFMNMLEGLLSYGINPFVVVPDDEGITQELKARKIHTLVVNYRPSTYPDFRTLKERLLFIPRLVARIILNFNATKAVEVFIKENRIDLVHSNSSVIRIGFDAAQKAKIPHIYHIREYGDLDFGYHYFPRKKSFIRQLSAEHSYSICITKDIQKYNNQQGTDTSRVIYDGVFNSQAELSEAPIKQYFLYAGRIQPAKGLDQLLLAYKQYTDLNDQPLPLKVAGSNSDDFYYKQQVQFIKDNKLMGKVELLGECDDIGLRMKQARALIIPSPNEGFGFCMPEAMQQGCLCIARNTGGTKEQLDNALDMTGCEIALRYESTEQLAELLSEVTNHPVSHYNDLTQKAFAVVNHLYTKENCAKKVHEFYNNILNDTNL